MRISDMSGVVENDCGQLLILWKSINRFSAKKRTDNFSDRMLTLCAKEISLRNYNMPSGQKTLWKFSVLHKRI